MKRVVSKTVKQIKEHFALFNSQDKCNVWDLLDILHSGVFHMLVTCCHNMQKLVYITHQIHHNFFHKTRVSTLLS